MLFVHRMHKQQLAEKQPVSGIAIEHHVQPQIDSRIGYGLGGSQVVESVELRLQNPIQIAGRYEERFAVRRVHRLQHFSAFLELVHRK